MNKQSNTYTIIYITALVAIVGAALAFTAMSLQSRQQDNANADKMRQILASVHIAPENADITAIYHKYITDSYIVNSDGDKVDGNAFDVDVAAQSKLPADRRLLPVYVCRTDNGDIKYIMPVYGAGLWGPIWGYIAVNADGRNIFGAYFAHQGETPGLGAEIEKPWFREEFDGKTLWAGDTFRPVSVVKAGKVPADQTDHCVDGVSGGTITSKGVSTMLADCLSPYSVFLSSLKNNDKN